MTLVAGIVVGVGIAGALALSAFRSNVTFFFDPTKVADGEVKAGQYFRLGGMVTEGSVKRAPGSLEVRFVVTDFKHDVPVSYTGVLPDLFREGTGVVAHGHMQSGTFVADEVLAKHDEKYMPPEVAKSLKRRHGEAREGALSGTQPGAGAEGQGQAGTAHAAESPQSPSTTSTQTPSQSSQPPSTTSTQAPSEIGQSPSTTSTQTPSQSLTPSPSITGAQLPSTGGAAVGRTITSEARAFSTPSPAGS
jgi:cytochrome c-type biogenesis protein CcmE